MAIVTRRAPNVSMMCGPYRLRPFRVVLGRLLPQTECQLEPRVTV